MKPVQVSWYIDVALAIGTVRLSVMPITRELWESISNMRSPWANDALNELRCCNVFTFAKRGFSSSIGYLAFDLSQPIQDATYESVLKAALDEQARITFVMSYSQEQVAEYTIGGLYGASLRVVY